MAEGTTKQSGEKVGEEAAAVDTAAKDETPPVVDAEKEEEVATAKPEEQKAPETQPQEASPEKAQKQASEETKVETKEPPPAPEEASSNSLLKKIILIIIPIVLIGAALAGGVYMYMRGVRNFDGVEEKPSATLPTTTPTPAAQPTSDLKRDDLKIQVLNGAGTTGIAGKAKEFLEGLGYKNIEIGNADRSDYTKTEISLKEEKNAFRDLLISDLSKDYSVADKIKTLDDKSEFDVVIVIGKQ